MDPKLIAPLRVLLLAVAGVLFIIGGYSDTNTTECWGWAFLLAVVAVIIPELPAFVGEMGRRRR